MKLGLKHKIVLVFVGVLAAVSILDAFLASYFTNRQNQQAAFTDLRRDLLNWQNELQDITLHIQAVALSAVGETMALSQLAELNALDYKLADALHQNNEVKEATRTLAYSKSVSLSRLHLVMRSGGFSAISVYINGHLSHYVSETEVGMALRRANGGKLWLKTNADANDNLPVLSWPAWREDVMPAVATWRSSPDRPSIGFVHDSADSMLIEMAVPVRGIIEHSLPEGEGQPSELSVFDARIAGQGNEPASAGAAFPPSTFALVVFQKRIDRAMLQAVADRTNSQPLLFSPDGLYRLQLAGEEFTLAQLAPQLTLGEIGSQIVATSQGSFYSVVLPWQFGEQPAFVLALVGSRDSTLQNISQTVMAILALTAMILALSIGVGIFGVGRFIDPILVLTDAVKAIGLGSRLQRGMQADYQLSTDSLQPLAIHAPGEIGELAGAFDLMIAELKYSFDTLEQRVAERTAELAGLQQALEGQNRQLEQQSLELTIGNGLLQAEIAERQRKQQQLELLTFALDQSDPAFVLDQGLIVYANRACQQTLEYSEDELIGLSVFDIVPDLTPSQVAEYRRKLTKQASVTFESNHKTRSGRIFPVEVSLTQFVYEGKTRVLSLARDITERKRIEAMIQHQASYDPLTGLPNRRLVLDRLHEEAARCRRHGTGLALLFIDLDRFKEVNDTLGHQVGDQLLVQAAARIRGSVRESDVVARLAGDEFVAIVPHNIGESHAALIGEHIVSALSRPFQFDGNVAYISASIGIACFPEDTDDVDQLLGCADQSMYAVKKAGRNGVSFFTPSLHDEAQERLQLSNDLRNALQYDQLQVHFQPIVDIATGRIDKAEALIRWRHPQRGMVRPDLFIPLAEETGAIHDIGDWVFRQSAAVAVQWQAMNGAGCQISVNMSPRQFTRGNPDVVWVEHLRDIGLQAEAIVIEITEGLLLDDQSEVMDKLLRFQQAGMQLALDDFGTGYSAMAYLKKFNIDYLKIDRSFIRDLETDPGDRAIAEAIVAMAHRLGLKVIAEGVETEGQRDLLAAVGCEYVQGYLYAKPMPAEAFLEFVGEGVVA